MSTVKANLKRARQALDAGDVQAASDLIDDVLAGKPGDASILYNAHVLQAVARSRLGKAQDAFSAYRKAIALNPAHPLAWQGLAKLCEAEERWDDLAEALNELARIYETEDAEKLADAVSKLIACRRAHGTADQLIAALSLLLPGSTIADTLASLPGQQSSPDVEEVGRLARKSITVLEEIVEIAETQERQMVDAEVKKRRMRLTSTPLSAEETRKAVEAELLPGSRLPKLYDQVLAHPQASDDARRSAESKLLRHRLQNLRAVPDPFAVDPETTLSEAQIDELRAKGKAAARTKDALRDEIEELVRGMVLLRFPDELAWRIALDWADVESISTSRLTT